MNKPLLAAIRIGFSYTIPFVFIGSFALLFISLPVQTYQHLMENIFGSQWQNIFLYIRDGTYNILSLIIVVCISYAYAIESNNYNEYANPIIATMVSLGSFTAISGISKEGFNLSNFGVIGIFIALLVAISSSLLFFKISHIPIFKIKTFSDGSNSNFNYTLTSIIPAGLTITIFALMNEILSVFFNISDIQIFFSNCLFNFFSGINSAFWRSILFIFFIHTFWFFGIHGSNMLEPVAKSIFIPALSVNQSLIASGQAPANIFTKTFFDTFVLMGGCGSGLCLILAILIAGKQKNQRQLSKLSFFPVLFNINELMVFGVPIVLNPIFVIPFISVPLILTLISYLAVNFGWVPYTINLVEWTTPVFLSGYISTDSISGSVLQFFNLIIGTSCYIPFIKLSEKISNIRMKNNLAKAYKEYTEAEKNHSVLTLLERDDEIGRIAKSLTAELKFNLQKNNITLFYQPISDYDDNVIFVEALLRWKHNNYGYINPPLIIALAEEAKLMTELGYQILDRSCEDLKAMNNANINDVIMSVNVSASQLAEENFVKRLDGIIKKHSIRPETLQIEITEGIALSNSSKIIKQVKSIKELGVRLAMDDFGMGHSSLLYLTEYHFDTIKLDGSLVREILPNKNCQNIVSSIVALGKLLNYTVIAEFVENAKQKNILHDLECNLYQGYLFSPAIPCKKAIEYIQSKKSISSCLIDREHNLT